MPVAHRFFYSLLGAALPFPATIASLKLWLESDSGLYSDTAGTTPQTTDTGMVRRWVNKLGTGNDAYRPSTDPFSGNGPALDSTNTLNGYQVVKFVGGSSTALLLPDFFTDSAGELFMVQKMAADPAASSGTSGHSWFGDSDFSSHFPFTDSILYDAFGTSVRKNAGNPSTSLAGWHIYGAHSAASDWENRINGTAQHTTTTNTVVWVRYSAGLGKSPLLGRSKTTDVWASMSVAAVLYFGAKLSSGDRSDVYSYLASRYGL